MIDFQPPKTFTLKRLNGDYFVKYTCTEKVMEQSLNILNGQKMN